MKKELEENEKGEKRESEEKEEGNDETGDKSQDCQEKDLLSDENNKEAVQSDHVASGSSQRDEQSDAPVALKLNDVREKSSAFEKAAVSRKEEKGPAKDGNEGRKFKIVTKLFSWLLLVLYRVMTSSGFLN